ncbi:MAG: xlnA 3, partial [Actinomycetia bacterium]|nr:xlnA 3 [Actinomycetes bacterium]
MTLQSPLLSLRQVLLLLGAALTLAVGALAAGSAPPAAAASLPCDSYASGGTPCVAAHSTTRALYASYSGPLYQVKRASDGATTNISPLSAGGYANAAAQDSFCAGTTCTITEI